ncbi:MAG: cyclic nucleotide-binding domain-containing protein [Proteobacteria bacterium]|nr:cyclic nucleotide-binding domain-containing protein [Pseudomonadota bacterium]
MLSIKGVPDELENIYTEYKNLSKEIYRFVEDNARPERLSANTNLFECAENGAYVYILEGYFKLASQDKILRLYSESDFVNLENNFAGLTLSSEFASDIVVFEKNPFLEKLHTNTEIFEKWIYLQNFENKISLSLCSFYLASEVEATFELREYGEGDVITKEGDPPSEIYEMINGNATVLLGERTIGRIGSGEIFGEISFLTERSRTATVIASGRCFVRIVKKEDFFSLIENNPHLGISISKTLANRIVDLNDRLVTGT